MQYQGKYKWNDMMEELGYLQCLKQFCLQQTQHESFFQISFILDVKQSCASRIYCPPRPILTFKPVPYHVANKIMGCFPQIHNQKVLISDTVSSFTILKVLHVFVPISKSCCSALQLLSMCFPTLQIEIVYLDQVYQQTTIL